MKKKRKKKKEETTGQNIMACPITQGGHKNIEKNVTRAMVNSTARG